MALLRDIGRGFRGIGRILRGRLRAGLGDIGAAVKAAAPGLAFIPGVGWTTAALIGAAGGAAERAGRRAATLGTVLGGAAEGAGRGVAGEAVQQYVARPLAGVARRLVGAGGAGAAAPSPATVMVPAGPGLMPHPAPAQATILPAGDAPTAAAAARGLFGDMDSLTRAYLISQGLGTALQAYGAGQEAAAEAARMELERELAREPIRRREELGPLVAAYLRGRGAIGA